MADSATVRITGPVLRVDVREGKAKADGRPYRMVTAKVLVQDGIAEAMLAAGMGEPTRGEFVDWLADVSMDVSEQFGASLRIRALSDYEIEGSDSLAGVHASA